MYNINCITINNIANVLSVMEVLLIDKTVSGCPQMAEALCPGHAKVSTTCPSWFSGHNDPVP